MPTYAYACTECEHEFDAQQSFSDASLTTCPSCEGRLRKKFGAVGVVFKGSGFYRNDSRNGSGSSSGDKGSSDKGSSETKPSGTDKAAGNDKAAASSSGDSKSGSADKAAASSGSGSSTGSSTGSKGTSAA